MKVIPSVSFMEETPVVVEGEDYRRYSSQKEKAALDQILTDLQDFDTLYLLDLNGIERNRPQLDLIRTLSMRKKLWADGGTRDIDTLTDMYIAGADRVVLSTKTAPSMDFIEESAELSNTLILSIDIDDEIISPSEEIGAMDLREMVGAAVEMGIDSFIFADYSDNEFDLKDMKNIDDELELYLVTDLTRLDSLSGNDMIDGAILGIKEAVQYQERN
ncbi:MAG: HisA/HisF-related TIM barrel protein [Thermoplasmata archaeon]